jgi:hypothetical protein
MSQWLQNFAYKTRLSWWIFALSGIIALCSAVNRKLAKLAGSETKSGGVAQV